MNFLDFDITSIPSIFESSPVALDQTTNKLESGLKIKQDDQYYIVGELAEIEGVMPHKELNCSPDSIDYMLLMKSALLIANFKTGNSVNLTTGFPFATYRLNKELALNQLMRNHIIDYDASTFTNASRRRAVVEVKSANVLPEVLAASLAVRSLDQNDDNFLMLSLGYGTFETMLSTAENALSNQRSSTSAFGIVYAVDVLRAELNNTFYTSMQNDRFFDLALQNGYIYLNRRKIDIAEIKADVLHKYYDNIISPHLKRTFTDKEFSKVKTIYLSGGGALYPEIVAKFKEEFDGFLEVKVPKNPHHLAVKGYCLNSLKLNGGDQRQAVGIDIGNASTLVCTLKNDVSFV
jgi:plasmid segregation protein ParM